MSACVSPSASLSSASCRWCGDSLRGRPNRTPRSLARLLPSPVLDRISSRSNSAKPPRTVSISRPCGLVVSAQVSLSDLKPAPRSLQCLDDVQQVAGGTRQPIEARDHQHVTRLQPGDHLGQLRAVALGAAGLLSIDLGAPRGRQLGNLAGEVLIPRRDPRISEHGQSIPPSDLLLQSIFAGINLAKPVSIENCKTSNFCRYACLTHVVAPSYGARILGNGRTPR